MAEPKTGKSWSAGPAAGAAYRPGAVDLYQLHDGILVTGSLSVDAEYPVDIGP